MLPSTQGINQNLWKIIFEYCVQLVGECSQKNGLLVKEVDERKSKEEIVFSSQVSNLVLSSENFNVAKGMIIDIHPSPFQNKE